MNAALVEMLTADGELDRILDGRGLEFTRTPPPPPAPPALVIPPWDGSSVVEPVREPDPPLVVEDDQAAPAKPNRKPKSATPRLDAAKTMIETDRPQVRRLDGPAIPKPPWAT